MSERPPRALTLLILFLLLSAAGCRDDGPKASPVTLPSVLEPITDPEARITNLEVVEDLSETVANRLIEWGDKLRKREYGIASDWLVEGFAGHDLSRLGSAVPTEHALGVTKVKTDIDGPPVVGKAGFTDALRAFLAPYSAIDIVLPKLKGAEFATGDNSGAVTIKMTALGRTSDGGRIARILWFRARVVEQRGEWRLERLFVTSLDETRRATPLFTEVSRSAGIAHRAPIFGKEGNDSFFWEGAACADADGDGRYDLFVPSDDRNFLYRNKGDGTFEDIAGAAGVAVPASGTSALFFDADHDGRTDLLVGHVGYQDKAEISGRPNALYRNVGGDSLHYENVTAASGLGELHITFGLSAADVNNDGFVDFHVASYNAEGFVAPDSWHEAGNGTPNALYINQRDGTFRNDAAAAGVADVRWSYAASFCDFDEDGDQDYYLANDYAANALYRNNGDGTFEDVAEKFGVSDVGNGMGVTWGDHDTDGDIDLYVSNMSSTAGNRILRRLASGSDGLEETLFKLAAGNSIFEWDGSKFERVPTQAGGVDASWAWSAQFDDLDIDGHQDLLCVNGFISGESLKDT